MALAKKSYGIIKIEDQIKGKIQINTPLKKKNL